MYDQEQQLEEEFVVPPLPIHPLNFQNQLSAKIKCKFLCIGFYGVSSLYVTSLVNTKDSPPLNRINFQRAKQRALASIYHSSETLFIIFHEEFQKMKEIHFSQFISKNFQFQELVIFTSRAKGLIEKDIVGNLNYICTSCIEQKVGGAQRYPQGLSGPEADLLQWGQINRVPITCYVGIYTEYEVKREHLTEIFGAVSGKYGLDSRYDITSQIRKYNMAKYGNKLYL